MTENDYQRLHQIAPIIICVYFPFNGEVQIEVEEDLDGDLSRFMVILNLSCVAETSECIL